MIAKLRQEVPHQGRVAMHPFLGEQRERILATQAWQRQMAHTLDELAAPGLQVLGHEATGDEHLGGRGQAECAQQRAIARIGAAPRLLLDHGIGEMGGVVAMVGQQQPFNPIEDEDDRTWLRSTVSSCSSCTLRGSLAQTSTGRFVR